MRPRVRHPSHPVNTMLIIGLDAQIERRGGRERVEWEDRLDEWELELELAARLEDSDWVPLERAAVETGASRAALRSWDRAGQIPSRLFDVPHGPQRLVPLAVVAARAEASPRLRRSAERRLADEAPPEILPHRRYPIQLRLAALERRQPSNPR